MQLCQDYLVLLICHLDRVRHLNLVRNPGQLLQLTITALIMNWTIEWPGLNAATVAETMRMTTTKQEVFSDYSNYSRANTPPSNLYM